GHDRAAAAARRERPAAGERRAAARGRGQLRTRAGGADRNTHAPRARPGCGTVDARTPRTSRDRGRAGSGAARSAAAARRVHALPLGRGGGCADRAARGGGARVPAGGRRAARTPGPRRRAWSDARHRRARSQRTRRGGPMSKRGVTLLETLVALGLTALVLAALEGTVMRAAGERGRASAVAERESAGRALLPRLNAEPDAAPPA